MIYQNILETVGNTPIVRLNKLFPDVRVYFKLERANPGGSIKDRVAVAMIEDAEKSGRLKPGGTIIEPTSGNTGIGLAMAAAVKGYELILVMPENMSVERQRLMRAYGAKVELTPKAQGMAGAIARARELAAEKSGAWIAQQFENPANPAAHEKTTAQEILRDFPDGLDILIGGVGSGGHLSGSARALKKVWPQLKVYAVEPAESPLLRGGAAGPHGIQGIGANFVPKNYDASVIDGVIDVPTADAKAYGRRCAREEGILIGISSGATLAAIAQKCADRRTDAKILAFNYDGGERYLSVEDYLF